MKKYIILFIFVFIGYNFSFSQGDDENTEDGTSLEDKIQNPIANMVSIPMNYNLSINDENANVLNIQPVIPVALSEKWLMITRTIVPFMNVPSQSGYQNGIGNITLLAAITPVKKSTFTWGIGPAFMLPTITQGLGFEKFSIGPSIAAINQVNGFTYGLLLQNFFSVSGPSDSPDVNFFYSQLILSKKLNNGWYLYSSPNITADWNAPSGKQWTIPLGLGGGKLIPNKYLPINLKAGVFKYVAHPTDADWLIQAQATFILKSN